MATNKLKKAVNDASASQMHRLANSISREYKKRGNGTPYSETGRFIVQNRERLRELRDGTQAEQKLNQLRNRKATMVNVPGDKEDRSPYDRSTRKPKKR